MGLGLGQRGGATRRGAFYTHVGGGRWVGWAVARCYVGWGEGEGLTGPGRAGTVPTVPGRAARQAGVAAHAGHGVRAGPARARFLPGRAVFGPCRCSGLSGGPPFTGPDGHL
jgi:hypothetical protein